MLFLTMPENPELRMSAGASGRATPTCRVVVAIAVALPLKLLAAVQADEVLCSRA